MCAECQSHTFGERGEDGGGRGGGGGDEGGGGEFTIVQRTC